MHTNRMVWFFIWKLCASFIWKETINYWLTWSTQYFTILEHTFQSDISRESQRPQHDQTLTWSQHSWPWTHSIESNLKFVVFSSIQFDRLISICCYHFHRPVLCDTYTIVYDNLRLLVIVAEPMHLAQLLKYLPHQSPTSRLSKWLERLVVVWKKPHIFDILSIVPKKASNEKYIWSSPDYFNWTHFEIEWSWASNWSYLSFSNANFFNWK